MFTHVSYNASGNTIVLKKMKADRKTSRQADRKGGLYQGPSEKVYEHLSLEGDTSQRNNRNTPLLINAVFLISVL